MNCQARVDSLETTIIKIVLHNNKNLFIISAYAPGNTKTNIASDLNDIFEELELYSADNYYLLAGDLNSKHVSWGDQKENYRGKKLFGWLEENQIRYRAVLSGPITPTFPAGCSLRDHKYH